MARELPVTATTLRSGRDGGWSTQNETAATGRCGPGPLSGKAAGGKGETEDVDVQGSAWTGIGLFTAQVSIEARTPRIRRQWQHDGAMRCPGQSMMPPGRLD